MLRVDGAWHYDGVRALRRQVSVLVDGAEFQLIEAGEPLGEAHRFNDLRRLPDQPGGAVYKHSAIEGWRLGFDAPPTPELAALLPVETRYGGAIDRWGIWRASAVFVALSAGVVALVLAAPQWLTPLVPASAERRLGDAMIGDFGGRFCDGAAGQAALAKLVRRIEPANSDVRVDVAKIDMVNAAALPGGRIILFQGLLDEASSPDEVAGVVGHEIGHVRKRHVMQSLLRQFGLSIFTGGLDSGVGGALGGALSLSYGREAEQEADQYAMTALAQANVSPRGTAAFFERMAKAEEGLGETGASLSGYLSTHPLSKARRDAFLKSGRPGARTTPALSEAEWEDLKTMCAKDPDAKSDMGFGF